MQSSSLLFYCKPSSLLFSCKPSPLLFYCKPSSLLFSCKLLSSCKAPRLATCQRISAFRHTFTLSHILYFDRCFRDESHPVARVLKVCHSITNPDIWMLGGEASEPVSTPLMRMLVKSVMDEMHIPHQFSDPRRVGRREGAGADLRSHRYLWRCCNATFRV